MAIAKFFSMIHKRPILVVEGIFAVCLILYGLYIGGPLYNPSAQTALGLFFEQTGVRIGVALLYLIPGSVAFIGFVRGTRGWQSAGAFLMFISFFFSTVFRIIAVGWTPLLWTFSLALALACAVFYIYHNWGGNG